MKGGLVSVFDVRYTLSRNNLVVTVYDVTYDSNGYPLFLFYDRENRAWVRKSAKYFIPVRTGVC